MLNFVNNIKLTNFRNHKKLKFDKFTKFNIFVGPNAVGKTNIIEAIELLTKSTSFKHSKIDELISYNEASSLIEASINNDHVTLFMDEKKQYKVNGKKKKALYPCVIFTPDDLMMVKGGNSLRRDVLDNLGSQLSKNYNTVRKDYSKALKQKNKMLKDDADDMTLKSINDVLVITGSQLLCYRESLINKIVPVLQDYYKQITGSKEELKVEYIPSFNIDVWERDKIREQYTTVLNSHFDEEKAKNKSLIGPQVDKIIFKINNKEATDFASQGQQRSIALAFKMTELYLIESLLKKTPILLLDDVMSELDATRRKTLISFVKEKAQVFITTTNLDYFDKELLEDANIIELCQQ